MFLVINYSVKYLIIEASSILILKASIKSIGYALANDWIIAVLHFPVFAQVHPNVIRLIFNNVLQKRYQVDQVSVCIVIAKPVSNFYSV